MDIKFIKRETLKEKPDFNNLVFGKVFTDYMFIMDYCEENGWHDARIQPYGRIEMAPSSCVLHYAQGLFEGMKAYKNGDEVYLFRPAENFKRLNDGCDRLCIPPIDVDLALNALNKLVDIERDWIPNSDGSALYIRPFIVADEEALGVHPAVVYRFMIILSPVASYYSGGFAPIDIMVEENYIRSAPGGTGAVKAIGNYAASLKGQKRASEQNCSQVMWLDGVEKKYVEEVGSMNIFFVINGELCTPSLSGSLLPGITRRSVIELAKSMGYNVVERNIEIEEIIKGAKDGSVTECFGSGTAVVISPVGSILYKGERVTINGAKTGEHTLKLYQRLTDIQYGRSEDDFGWRVVVG